MVRWWQKRHSIQLKKVIATPKNSSTTFQSTMESFLRFKISKFSSKESQFKNKTRQWDIDDMACERNRKKNQKPQFNFRNVSVS